jgi:hypothetical protein
MRTLAQFAFVLMVLATGSASAVDSVRIPIVVHVAELAGQPVAPPAFIDEQLARANEIFGPLGFELTQRAGKALASRHAELTSRSDRDALAPYVRRGAIHCFVVAKLMDVDEAGRERRGVHWHERRKSGVHFVIVSRISGPYVLAHELGHYFGNPLHSDVAGNLMSYTPGEGPPSLDEAQRARVRTTLTRMLASGELIAIRPARKSPQR